MNSENAKKFKSQNPILIEINKHLYFWNLDIKSDVLIISIYIIDNKCELYQISKTLEDWKKIHFLFGNFESLEKIKEFMINALNKKDITINLSEKKFIIDINVQFFYEKQKISIELEQKELNKDELIQKLCNIIINMKKGESSENEDFLKEMQSQKSEIISLKNETEKLNQKFNELKISYDALEQTYFYGSSIIRNKEEVNLLFDAIKQRLGKNVKYFKIKYKATLDGQDAGTFHKLCDNIENTISFVKTGGHRRFGGFTTQTWNQVSSYTKTDKDAFVFSLDKLKIYPYTNNGRAIRCDNRYHPTFGVGACDFRLCGNPLTEKTLYTDQKSGDRSYNYNGDINALSEDGSGNCISTLEIEVYQVILE